MERRYDERIVVVQQVRRRMAVRQIKGERESGDLEAMQHGASGIELKHGHEGALRHLDSADLAHPFLAFLLLLK